jgi:hypothetical protein
MGASFAGLVVEGWVRVRLPTSLQRCPNPKQIRANIHKEGSRCRGHNGYMDATHLHAHAQRAPSVVWTAPSGHFLKRIAELITFRTGSVLERMVACVESDARCLAWFGSQ